MVGEAYILVTINLKEVATEGINDKTADPKLMIVLKIKNLLGIPERLD